MVKPARRGSTEIRPDDDGALDEVCAWGFVHLERMDVGSWSLIIDTVDGKRLHANLHAKRAAVVGFAEIDGSSELATPLLPSVRVAIGRDRRRINRNRRRAGMKTLRQEGM